MDKPKKSLVVGWHDYKNTGDDAMGLGIAWWLKKNENVEKVDLFCKKENLPNCSLLPNIDIGAFFPDFLPIRLRKIYFYLKSWQYHILVFGGGNIFHSENSISWKYNFATVYKKIKNGSIYCISVGVAPPNDTAAKKLKRFSGLVKRWIVRDKFTFDFLKKIGCQNEKISLQPDFAFFLPEICHQTLRNRKPIIGLSLVNFPRTNSHISFIVENITHIARKKKLKVRVFSFCGDPIYGDDDINRFAANILAKSNVEYELVAYNRNPCQTLDKISECEAVVAMRLHSAIFSYLTETPFLIIEYDKKSLEFKKSINLCNDRYLTSFQLSSFRTKLEKLLR